MLSWNVGYSNVNRKPDTVRDSDGWLEYKKQELWRLREEFRQQGLYLVFLQEVDKNKSYITEVVAKEKFYPDGERQPGIDYVANGPWRLSGLESGPKKCWLWYDPDEWSPVGGDGPTATPFADNPVGIDGWTGQDNDALKVVRPRMCHVLLQPRPGEHRRRFLLSSLPDCQRKVPLPTSCEDNLSAIKLLAVSFHMPYFTVPDLEVRKRLLGVLLKALCAYANQYNVYVAVGGDFNLDVPSQIEAILANFPDGFASQVQVRNQKNELLLKRELDHKFTNKAKFTHHMFSPIITQTMFPEHLVGVRAGQNIDNNTARGNIDGFFIVTPRVSVHTNLNGRFRSEGEAEMRAHRQYQSQHPLFDHEPVYLNYRLESRYDWLLREISAIRNVLPPQVRHTLEAVIKSYREFAWKSSLASQKSRVYCFSMICCGVRAEINREIE
jgi:hypothetical protein